MALTFTKPTNWPHAGPVNIGSLQLVSWDVTFDSSYPTGGEAVTAGQVGLNSIVAAIPGLGAAADESATVDVKWDHAASKLILFTDFDTEATDESNQSAIVSNVTFIGF